VAENDEFNHESLQDRSSIVQYLRALTAGIESGRIELSTAAQTLVLEPEGMLDLQIRARRKAGRIKLSVKIGWREGESEVVRADPLSIRADDPDPT